MGEQESERGTAYFNLDLPQLAGTMQIIEIGGRPITTHARPIWLTNAGGGGLSLLSEDDLPIRRGVVAQFGFDLGQQRFSFRGELIWKMDDRRTYQYAVAFVDVDEYQRGLLISSLGRMQVAFRKAGGPIGQN